MEFGAASERSRECVDETLAALRATYDEVPVVDKRWRVDPATYDDYAGRVARDTIGGAGTWVTRRDGRVLFVTETDRDTWSEPSGHHEPGESLEETAVRETREETGLDVEITGVGFVSHVRVTPDGDDGPPIHRLIGVFEAEPVGGTLRPQPDEIDAVRWFDRHPRHLLYEDLRDLAVPAFLDSRP